ncbi:MAG: DUF1294 domain-containing protein [Saprospiraceae bacterium]|nr:DUF1294 domain-containing protein [Saprospiraceae bacterium]MBK8670433.1 DUF1294 domain-containing protein [Saprospiraceae bacterium]MBL0102244.1 DUF1294 domain-containing protein [Saprospiraceae bacterium]
MSFVLILICINLSSYIVMWKDKRASQKGKWRCSEKFLFTLALFGGSVGIYAGMKSPLYHKSAKSIFKVGIPIIILVQLGLIWWWLGV